MSAPATMLPIGAAEAAALFEPLRAHSSLLLAVSGGPDSMALLGLAAEWAAALPLQVAVATVDHGLRSESAAEAALVGAAARALGLRHDILPWRGAKPETGLQSAARAARYRALADHAAALGAGAIVTAHHADDQAETVLLRLAGGSGLAGLAGMAAQRPLRPGVALCRPLLAAPKARLIATCQVRGWPFVDDPSNGNGRFARARLRGAMPALAAEGLTRQRLQRLAMRAGRAERALTAVADGLWPALAAAIAADRPFAAGLVLDQPEEIALRLLDRAIALAADRHGVAAGPDRLERLERLLADLLAGYSAGVPVGRTLRGVAVRLSPSGRLRLLPAPPRGIKGSASKPLLIG